LKIRPFRVNKKAVSPVIATLLMIAIAVASGTLVYVWSMGIVGTLQSSGGQQTKQQLMMEAYKAVGTSWEFNLRNPGSATLQIAAVYVNGTSCTPPSIPPLAPTNTLKLTVNVSGLSGLTMGVGYPVKIVTVDGAVFTFTVIYGRSE
jgi:flagellin-like protein